MESGNKEIVLGFNRGGEVGKLMLALDNLTFNCTCGERITIRCDYILGCRHSEGVKDQYGITWWMYVRCPKCSYDWALWKIREKITRH